MGCDRRCQSNTKIVGDLLSIHTIHPWSSCIALHLLDMPLLSVYDNSTLNLICILCTPFEAERAGCALPEVNTLNTATSCPTQNLQAACQTFPVISFLCAVAPFPPSPPPHAILTKNEYLPVHSQGIATVVV